MKRTSVWVTVIAVIVWATLSPPITFPQETPPYWQVYFSPKGGCTDAIIRELNKAKSTILVQAYSFTSAPIAKALLNAHKRGVKVEVISSFTTLTTAKNSSLVNIPFYRCFLRWISLLILLLSRPP